MSDLISAKNKLRLHLRKARQKTIKNLKRDCAKYKNDEHIKLLSQVKEKTDLSTVFQTVINCKSKDFEELLSGLDSEFEKRIIKALISNSEIKELVENLWQELSAFQGKTTKNKTLGEKLEDVAKIKKVDESSIERPKPEKTNTPKLTRKEKLAQKLAKKVPKNVTPRINDDSSSSDDDFFENPKRPKTEAKNEEEELKLDFIGHSRYSKDRKRNYQEKRDFVLNQKEEEKKNSAAHKRSHKHIIEGVAHKLHPSWQAKIDAKKSLEAGGAVNKNKRIKFDDSDNLFPSLKNRKMVQRKFKHEAGAVTQFISRKKARKKLQISLADFRRLCILKGIYPHEPKNKKKVNKGSTAPKTFYFKKDIDFLAHEPLIEKFRKHKATIKKLKRATGRKEYDKANHVRETMEAYTVDHIVLERYPNFIDAIRDLDDALTLIFLFATFPQSRKTHSDMIRLCKRLKYEFLNYVIETKAIRKCFISIKGIYIQAEIFNEPVTWVMPHISSYNPAQEVDFRVLQTFAEFYTHLLGFTISKLYKKEGLVYPPQVVKTSEEDLNEPTQKLVESLQYSLVKIAKNSDEEKEEDDSGAQDLSEEQKKIRAEEEKQTNLFKNKKFFLNRETPKEILTLLIRSCSGQVEIDPKNLADSDINYQIVDRGKYTDMSHSATRSYLQPQWIFDSINTKILLPVERFLPGSELPAHLSPFVQEKEGAYKPPERVELEAMARGADPGLIYGQTKELEEPEDEKSDFDEEEGGNFTGIGAENADEEESEDEEEEEDNDDENEEKEEEDEEPKEEPKPSKKPKKEELKVTIKKGSKDAPKGKYQDQDQAEEIRLAKSAMPKKLKRLDQKIHYGIRKEKRENEKLASKRKIHDENVEKRATRSSKRNKN